MESDGTPRYVSLNVGGIYYTTKLSTLTRYRDSLLYEIFSKTTIVLGKDTEGRYFIDRDGGVFRYILNFLRDERLNPHLDKKEYYQLREEVAYYKLKKMKSLLDNWENKEMLGLDPDITGTENDSDRELSDESDAPSWFMSTKPHKSPYVPQMGDEVMYFWQGHKRYVEDVKTQGVYDIDEGKLPWNGGDLKTEELMRVVGLEYRTGPTITCEIKLASLDQDSKELSASGKNFNFRYHVMPGMKDFMILTQYYETSMQKEWKVGDRFRAVIDNKWWSGVIEQKKPMDEYYPESVFQCYAIRWNYGSEDVLSPWDLDQNDNKNSHDKFGRGVSITEADMVQLRYNPKAGDWDESDQNIECDRILACLDQILSLEFAKILTVPTDRIDESDGPMVVPYPIEFATIRKRLEKRFYRRRHAVQWEVRQIVSNAPLFNELNSDFVKSADLVTNILLEVVRNVKVDNAVDLYNRMVVISDTKQKTKKKGKKRPRRVSKVSYSGEESDDETKIPSKKRRSRRTHDENRWITECQTLLNNLCASENSKYFRIPINWPTSVFHAHANVIEEPMDLTTVKERMNNEVYEDPLEFAKDIRLIVSNSKACFIDKHSEIHTLTREFSKFFEDEIRDTLKDYKSAAAFKKLPKGNGNPSSIQEGNDQKWSPRKKPTLNEEQRTPSGIQKGNDQKRGPRKKPTLHEEPRNPSGIQEGNDQKLSPRKKPTLHEEPRTPSGIQEGNDQKRSPRKKPTLNEEQRTPSGIQEGNDQKRSPRKKPTLQEEPRNPSSIQEGNDQKRSPRKKPTLNEEQWTPSGIQEGNDQKRSPRKKPTLHEEPRNPSGIQEGNDQKRSPRKKPALHEEPRNPSGIQEGYDQKRSPRKKPTLNEEPRTLSTVQKGKDRKQSPQKKLTIHDKPGPSGTQKGPNKSWPSGPQMYLQEGRPLLRGDQYPKHKNREAEWLRSLPSKIPQSLIEEFKHVIWNRISDEILPGYGMTPDRVFVVKGMTSGCYRVIWCTLHKN